MSRATSPQRRLHDGLKTVVWGLGGIVEYCGFYPNHRAVSSIKFLYWDQCLRPLTFPHTDHKHRSMKKLIVVVGSRSAGQG